MKKNSVLKILNPILAVLLLSQLGTGLLRDSLPDEAFEVIHEGGGILLAVLVLLHVILNWNWVKANFWRTSPTGKR